MGISQEKVTSRAEIQQRKVVVSGRVPLTWFVVRRERVPDPRRIVCVRLAVHTLFIEQTASVEKDTAGLCYPFGEPRPSCRNPCREMPVHFQED